MLYAWCENAYVEPTFFYLFFLYVRVNLIIKKKTAQPNENIVDW